MSEPGINPGALNVAGVEAATDAIMALCGATNGVNSRDIYREDALAAIEAYLQAAPSEPQEERIKQLEAQLQVERATVAHLMDCIAVSDSDISREYRTVKKEMTANPGKYKAALAQIEQRVADIKRDHPKAASEPHALLSEHRCVGMSWIDSEDPPYWFLSCKCIHTVREETREKAVNVFLEHYAQWGHTEGAGMSL